MVSKEIMDEYVRVFAYPRFCLTAKEVTALLERQILVFSHPITVKNVIPVIREDPSDDIFLACAAAGKAGFIVSGDKHLLGLKRYLKSRIVSVATFLSMFSS